MVNCYLLVITDHTPYINSPCSVNMPSTKQVLRVFPIYGYTLTCPLRVQQNGSEKDNISYGLLSVAKKIFFFGMLQRSQLCFTTVLTQIYPSRLINSFVHDKLTLIDNRSAYVGTIELLPHYYMVV